NALEELVPNTQIDAQTVGASVAFRACWSRRNPGIAIGSVLVSVGTQRELLSIRVHVKGRVLIGGTQGTERDHRFPFVIDSGSITRPCRSTQINSISDRERTQLVRCTRFL